MSPHVTLSSARQDWRTPEWFLDLVRAVGPISLDPAADRENSTGAEVFHARDIDTGFPHGGEWRSRCGLAGSWIRGPGPAFINPPYGGHLSGPVEPEYEHTKKCGTCEGTGKNLYGATCHGMVCPDCYGATVNGLGSGRVLVGKGRGWAARIVADQGEWIALVPVRTETVWWRLMHSAADYAILWSSPEHGSRIQFVDPDTGKAKAGSNLASTVFYHGPRPERFLESFAPHGRVIPGEKTLIRLLTAA